MPDFFGLSRLPHRLGSHFRLLKVLRSRMRISNLGRVCGVELGTIVARGGKEVRQNAVHIRGRIGDRAAAIGGMRVATILGLNSVG